MASVTSGFSVVCGGQIESVEFGGIDNLYCKYSFLFGPDWKILNVSRLFMIVMTSNAPRY